MTRHDTTLHDRRCNTIKYAIQYNTRCNIIQCNTIRDAIQYNMRCNTIRYARQFKPAQPNVIQGSATSQRNTIQRNTIQYFNIKYNSISIYGRFVIITRGNIAILTMQ